MLLILLEKYNWPINFIILPKDNKFTFGRVEYFDRVSRINQSMYNTLSYTLLTTATYHFISLYCPTTSMKWTTPNFYFEIILLWLILLLGCEWGSCTNEWVKKYFLNYAFILWWIRQFLQLLHYAIRCIPKFLFFTLQIFCNTLLTLLHYNHNACTWKKSPRCSCTTTTTIFFLS